MHSRQVWVAVRAHVALACVSTDEHNFAHERHICTAVVWPECEHNYRWTDRRLSQPVQPASLESAAVCAVVWPWVFACA